MSSQLYDQNDVTSDNGMEQDDHDAGGEEFEEEEEEDMDFNPFLKETPSPTYASSSLSSEVDGGQEEGGSTNLEPVAGGEGSEAHSFAVGYSEQGEVIWNPNACEKKLNVVDDEEGDEVDDEEDAICTRTRARYSLASCTLDELETFLQESDDEDDLRNVDDEEEYRKFLAAVLQGPEDANSQEMQNEGDEEEENDADFEIELEELLESDADEEIVKVEDKRGGEGRELRRPETRQNRRQIAYEKRLLEQTKRPLLPLLPSLPNTGYAAFPFTDSGALMPVGGGHYFATAGADVLINGFTPQQIGKLHCLIYEHVQLLVQVYSLTVFDVSRQHVASQVQKLLNELLQKRDETIKNRKLAYPDVCFSPPFMCSSVADDMRNSSGSCQLDKSQPPAFWWVPSKSGPTFSVLDVAPLNHIGMYVEDVSNVIHEHKMRQISASSDSFYEKEPLFCFPNVSSWTTTNGDVVQGDALASNSNLSSVNSQQQVKKTLAASIVEKAKKESIACVPKDISKLAQRFVPLFNPSMFPHKPLLVANRILFTDAEDELLAIGILEFNNDWKAIQQRFLPCKSEHQIFVRQKNRSSSKASENPIKAVRRMKNSPLTAEEVERIQEGLRVFKSDWTSVWRFVVPYRDPSLLPRLWRIARGAQKSYKSDAAKNEKRRQYEYEKRLRQANLARGQSVSEKENQIACSDRGKSNSESIAGAYVHQAFLADWRPEVPPGPHLSEKSSSIIGDKHRCEIDGVNDSIQNEQQINLYGPKLRQQPPTSGVTCSTTQLSLRASGKQHGITKFPYVHTLPQNDSRTCRLVRLAPDLPPVNLPPSVRVISQPAFRHSKCMQPAKLSVLGNSISNSSKVTQRPVDGGGAYASNSTSISGIQGTERMVSATVEAHARASVDDRMAANNLYDDEDRDSDSVMEMHPLLFQTSEAGEFHYNPSISGTGPTNSSNFISGNQVELNLGLFHNSLQAKHNVHASELDASAASAFFHPLLQRSDDEHIPSSLTKRLVQKSPIRCKPFDDSKPQYNGKESQTTEPEYCLVTSNEETGDNSHLGIVMEQEELSDSDEEMEEHVEFECEEMDDSEDDAELLHEPALHGETNKDCLIEDPSLPNCIDHETKWDKSIPRKANATAAMIENPSVPSIVKNTTLVSMNSDAIGKALLLKAKDEVTAFSEKTTARPTRSSKRTSSLNSLASKKPRKRGSKD